VTASVRRTVIVWVAALGVAVILVAAAVTGPVGVIEDLRPGSTTSETGTEEAPSESQSSEKDTSEQAQRGFVTDLYEWLNQLLAFALIVAGVWVGVAVLRALAARLNERLPDKQLVLDLDPLPDVEAARETLRSEHASYVAALDGPDVRNGIVACWVLLEETAAALGVARQPAETATEFVIRFLHTLDVDPRPVAALAALYHEARFSSHALPADARSRARAALEGIRQDLDQAATW
jgi:hypothetical protein